MKNKRHFGKLLNKSIRKEEHNISKIARLLKISRPTMYSRITDGAFTSAQLKKLHDKNYIKLTDKELAEIE